MKIQSFTFNPFSENTYVLWDDTLECVIIDPGCYEKHEELQLENFISDNKLKPVALLNTHCHIDHILGNYFVAKKYALTPKINPIEKQVMDAVKSYAHVYGINYTPSPDPDLSLNDNDVITFGNTSLRLILAPGHSPGSICFYNEAEKILIGGDVLFLESIGRTDLPGGNHDQLLRSIRERIFTLPPEVKVYAGHMDPTTVGHEIKHNPFL
jgi:hydroxyacylglutathione hydrolase